MTKTNTLTEAVFDVVKRNKKRGVTTQQIVSKLEDRFPFGLQNSSYLFIDRQTVSGRVSELVRKGKVVGVTTRYNKDTRRAATVYSVPEFSTDPFTLDNV